MLYELVMKDFVLIKKYMFFIILVAIGFPVFFGVQNDSSQYGGFILFFIVAIVIQFVSFSGASTIEYKSRGSVLLCATPYTRKTQVQAKYLFNLVTFIICFLIYKTDSLILPSKVVSVSISEIGLSLLISSVFFGIFIPAQYKFGFEKTRIIFQLSVVALPFILSFIVKLFKGKNITLNLSLPTILQDLLPFIIATIITLISMSLSIKIYSNKDL